MSDGATLWLIRPTFQGEPTECLINISVSDFLPKSAYIPLEFLEKLDEYQPVTEGELQDNVQCLAEKCVYVLLTEKTSSEVVFSV
ncbi:hypothetical protein [Balneatrix alpica]|uniref:Uncharacterized protein n=1 Tax=Balneatrix alpica TaxID=75684 RepID=A0ABV5ZGK8_9GAMM|nr:hypothetical protein [Balneatrix alpica]